MLLERATHTTREQFCLSASGAGESHFSLLNVPPPCSKYSVVVANEAQYLHKCVCAAGDVPFKCIVGFCVREVSMNLYAGERENSYKRK